MKPIALRIGIGAVDRLDRALIHSVSPQGTRAHHVFAPLTNLEERVMHTELLLGNPGQHGRFLRRVDKGLAVLSSDDLRTCSQKAFKLSEVNFKIRLPRYASSGRYTRQLILGVETFTSMKPTNASQYVRLCG